MHTVNIQRGMIRVGEEIDHIFIFKRHDMGKIDAFSCDEETSITALSESQSVYRDLRNTLGPCRNGFLDAQKEHEQQEQND